MSDGRSLAEPAFPDDDGLVDDALAPALGDLPATLSVLAGARVFVPVVAVAGETPVDGDKDAEMAAVLMTGADGRSALLAFSSVTTMQRWNADARPVPVYGRVAAMAALDEGASAMLLDVGSEPFIVVETDDLRQVAAGRRLAASAAGPVWVG